MMKQTILPVLLIGLFWVARLEGGGQGHFGARGSAHFGNQRNAGSGARVRSYGRGFGYRAGGWRGLGFGSRYPRSSYRTGVYFPGYYLYGYESYIATTPGADSLIPEYDEGSQPYYTKTPVPNEKINCKDTWTGGGDSGSLSGAMTRLLQLQCENGHTSLPSEPKNPAADRSTRYIPYGLRGK